jgi:uncharacterized protein Yka (UPF0111/DUF47 family)
MAASLKAARMYDQLVGELYKLLATSFSKEEIRETLQIVPEVEKLEHDVDVLETALLKKTSNMSLPLGGAGVCHLMGLVERIGALQISLQVLLTPEIHDLRR